MNWHVDQGAPRARLSVCAKDDVAATAAGPAIVWASAADLHFFVFAPKIGINALNEPTAMA